MRAPLLARILGVAFLLFGLLGFVSFVTMPAGLDATYITLGGGYGFVLGLFPVNVVHDALHVLFGIWGVLASLGFAASVRYCRWVTWIYALLFLFGIIPITNTLFGVMPIYGHDVWLHALIALFAAYGAYGRASNPPPPPEPEATGPPTPFAPAAAP